jgi:hypothetical protein
MQRPITWKRLKEFARQRFAPIGDEEDTPPDHAPVWVLRNGVPDLCCDRHRVYPRDEPFARARR